MKGRLTLLLVLITFSMSVCAEYYVVAGTYEDAIVSPYGHPVRYKHKIKKKPLICPTAKPYVVKKKYHHRRHLKVGNWWVKKSTCYSLDLATGDDDPCLDPNMNIDK